MNPLFIFLTLPKSVTIIIIVLVLVVAAIIGFYTAWFYSKSKYVPVVEGLEADKAELEKQVQGLTDEVAGLKADNKKLNNKVKKLEKEIAQKEPK